MSAAAVQTSANEPDADELLEVDIDSVASVLPLAPDRETKLSVWALLVRLIGLRSPAQIERLERQRGLRS